MYQGGPFTMPSITRTRIATVLAAAAAGLLLAAGCGTTAPAADKPQHKGCPAGSIHVTRDSDACTPTKIDDPIDEVKDKPAPAKPKTVVHHTTKPKPKPKPAPPAKPVAYHGTGDTILNIHKPKGVKVGFAKITYQGGSNFVVETIGSQQLMVNTIGNYSGVVAFDLDGTPSDRLKITASGPWTITLLPFEGLRTFDDGKISGHGDDVLLYIGDSAVADITHNGQSNFVVELYGVDDERSLLVNEIGHYSGQQLFTASGLLVITADGDWTINATAD